MPVEDGGEVDERIAPLHGGPKRVVVCQVHGSVGVSVLRGCRAGRGNVKGDDGVAVFEGGLDDGGPDVACTARHRDSKGRHGRRRRRL